MRAVIWTDVFQFLVMLAGMSAVLIKVTPMFSCIDYLNNLKLVYVDLRMMYMKHLSKKGNYLIHPGEFNGWWIP